MATQAQLAAVQQLYVGYLGRAADSAGQQFWANAIANGTATIASVATGFTLSAEYKAAYGGLTTDALVEKVYNNVLGRTPDAEGKAFWVAALANGKVTADTLVATIVTNLGALDQQTINNKVFVAQTYTDTVGNDYSPTAAAQVLVGVDSTAASVSTAIGTIANGTLPGLVPGLAQINAITSAEAALTASEKAAATANPALDTDKDGLVDKTELAAAAKTASDDRKALTGDSTGVAKATLVDLNTALANAKTAATAVAGGNALVNAYDAAIANQTAVKGTAEQQTANAAAEASAKAGFTTAIGGSSTVTWATLDSKTLAASDITHTASLYTALTLTTISSAERAALVTEVNKLGNFGAALVTAADKTVAANAADAAAKTATDALTAQTPTGPTYISASTDAKAQAELVGKLDAADALVASTKAAVDANASLETAVTGAQTALDKFVDANKATISINDLKAAGPFVADSAKSDVFYFASKAATANDVAIGGAAASTHFGAGDSLVLGSQYTFNSGALSAGDNNVSEFFLVQSSAGVQVVVENTAFGSSTVAAPAATGVIAPSTIDSVSVITLTGVTIDHVSVANGVVSYV